MLSIELPMMATFRAASASLNLANSTNSVVHTGVKSAGWEKRITHLSFCQVERRIGPCVVFASKSGAGPLSSMRGCSVAGGGLAVVVVMTCLLPGTLHKSKGAHALPQPSAEARRPDQRS